MLVLEWAAVVAFFVVASTITVVLADREGGR
jgi:hypothetical protein